MHTRGLEGCPLQGVPHQVPVHLDEGLAAGQHPQALPRGVPHRLLQAPGGPRGATEADQGHVVGGQRARLVEAADGHLQAQ